MAFSKKRFKTSSKPKVSKRKYAKASSKEFGISQPKLSLQRKRLIEKKAKSGISGKPTNYQKLKYRYRKWAYTERAKNDALVTAYKKQKKTKRYKKAFKKSEEGGAFNW